MFLKEKKNYWVVLKIHYPREQMYIHIPSGKFDQGCLYVIVSTLLEKHHTRRIVHYEKNIIRIELYITKKNIIRIEL